MSPVEYGLYPPLSITGFFLGVMLLAGAIMLALPLAGILDKHAFTAAMTLFVTGLGVLLPTAVAAALAPFPHIAGSAAAILGFMQMAGGALGTVAVSALSTRAPVLAFPLVMAGSSLLAAAWFASGLRPRTIPLT